MKKLIGSLLAIAVLTFMSAANAMPPTRWTVGPLIFVGFYVGNCGDFNILSDYGVHSDWVLYYDDAGNPVRLTRKVFVENGNAIYYNSSDPSYWLPGGNGEREVNTFDLVNRTVTTTAASFKVKLPGDGVIFMNAGRIVLDRVTGEVLFQAGQMDFYDGNLDALCAALRP
jgi:hypothetical protein